MIAGPLCLGGEVTGSEEATGSRETVFTFTRSTPAEARGSAEAEQRAGAELFPVGKIKDALVGVFGCGRHQQAYWWHFNPWRQQ